MVYLVYVEYGEKDTECRHNFIKPDRFATDDSQEGVDTTQEDTTQIDTSTQDTEDINEILNQKKLPMINLDNQLLINEFFQNGNVGFDGDAQLSNAMKNVSVQSKQATLNRTRFTSDNFRQYFQEELDEAEQRIWWEDDINKEMVKDDINWET